MQISLVLCGILAPVLAAQTESAVARREAAVEPRASLDHLEALAALWLDDELPAFARAVTRALAEAAQRSPVSAVDAARLETSLALADLALEDFAHVDTFAALFDGLALPTEAHALRARAAWLARAGGALSPLGDWSFTGPFDNERGRGMTRPTPPERDPAAERYEGKLREVEWRTTPPLGPDGIAHIGALIHPEQQACIVARTWIRAAAPREARLLLGASEEVRVWWNGAHVLDALGEHEFAPDAHALSVRLDAGWNELFVKVGAQDGALTLTARLVDPEDAAPLALETSSAPPEGLDPRAPKDPGRRARTTNEASRPGALAFYAGRTDAEALVSLALLRRDARSAPRKERPGAADAAAALAAAPGSAVAALAVLTTARVSGALAVEEDVNPWLVSLRAALAEHGDRPLLLRWYADHARHGQGLNARSLELLERGLAQRPSSVPLRLLRVEMLDAIGQAGLAARGRRVLIEDPLLLEWPRAAYELGDGLPAADPARARLIGAASAAGHRGATRQLELDGRLARRSREPAEVLDALGRDLALDPWDVQLRARGSQKLLALGAAAAAGALLDEAIALCPDAPELHSLRARALLVQGDVDEAVSALERVLQLDLSAADEQRLLEHLQSTGLGELAGGAVAADAPFQSRFQEPLDAVLARHPARPPASGESALQGPREVLLSRMVVEVGTDGTARRYHRVVERVLTEAGANELDRRAFRAYPGQEEVRVLTAVVRRADGALDRARTGRTGGRGTFVVDLPPLAPGDVVDFEWRHDDLRPSIFGAYFGLDARLVPDTRLAVRESEVVVLARPGVELSFHISGDAAATRDIVESESVLPDGTRQRTWRSRDFAPRRAEALEPPSLESQPRVQASTYASWEDFGRWWWNLIREELAVSPEMSAKVAELVEGRVTPLEKLRAIYDFVVTDIRYNAWEFGINGYRPYSAPVIFSRRFGDCKDKAILMRALLSEVGIEAWPVIIRSEGRRFEEDLSAALIAHFNHCIAYVPAQEGIPEMFLDGTARLHPLEVLPDSDRGARVIVVRDTGAEVVRIPFPVASDNVMRERTEVDLRGDQGPAVTLVRAPTGRFDPRERHLFTGTDEARKETVEKLLTARFGALVGEAEAQHADYEDLTRPVEVTLRSRVERIGRETPGGLELPTTFDPLRLLGTLASETERATDVLLDVPWTVDREVTYDLPPGARAPRLPDPRQLANEDLAYDRTVEAREVEGALRLLVRERFELRTHRVPVDRYPAFRALAREIDEAQREVIDVEVAR